MTNTREVTIMSHHARREPPARGAWSAEPVHDAIVTARMLDLRNGHMDAFDPHEVIAHAAEPQADRTAHRAAHSNRSAGPRSGRIRALRYRIGRALVAFGSYVEGPCDCPGGVPGVGAA